MTYTGVLRKKHKRAREKSYVNGIVVAAKTEVAEQVKLILQEQVFFGTGSIILVHCRGSEALQRLPIIFMTRSVHLQCA